jgi:hypothetical protein
MARCPGHEDREPSLSITDAKGGKVLVRCHAGCDQRAVIAALCSRGIWETEGRQQGRSPRKDGRRPSAAPDPDALKRTEAALAIWQASQRAVGTPVETYLWSRGDVLMVGEGIETCLAAMQATGQAAWAALSTSGLRTLELPVEARDVVVLADGDEPGEVAAHDAARCWKRGERRVRIAAHREGLS